jgi:cell division protease FtsH
MAIAPTQRPAQAADDRPPSDKKNKTPDQTKFRLRSWWWTFLLVLAANWVLMTVFFPEPTYVSIPYTTFKDQVIAGNVEEVTSQGDAIQGRFRQEVTYPPSGPNSHTSNQFKTQRPAFAAPGLETLLEEKGVVVNARPLDEGRPLWQNALLGFGPTLLLIGAFIWLSRRMSASGGGVFGIGRSRAKRYSEEKPTVTFDDVAGIEDAENELVEIVDFLKNPEKYQRLGGTVPKGVLLIGAPGTGKTLLARAVAGQAGVPFFSLSASEFIEMIVGVGAARVRDLFKQARESAPSIIFIDELDAIGRARGAGGGIGGHDEREQTLNQILTEMDGFDSREGVIILAATNRADVLDPALLRPGRFDRRVVVQRPDRAGREAILKVHTRDVPLAKDVQLSRVAGQTPGLVGAELRNLVNEAALLAARKGQSEVHERDFSEAMEKITLGPARQILLNPADRERTAYHESGHAVLGLLVPGSDPVKRVTIVPRGMALGVTYQLPMDDRTNYPEDYLRARITSALGGRAAEKLIYGIVTTGAENDLQQVTEIARQMVLRWGMSEKLGPLSFAAPPQDEGLPPAFQRQPYSDATAELIDAEVRRIVDECHREADSLLAKNRDKLVALATALLKEESLDEEQILEVTGLSAPPSSSREAGPARAAAMADTTGY